MVQKLSCFLSALSLSAETWREWRLREGVAGLAGTLAIRQIDPNHLSSTLHFARWPPSSARDRSRGGGSVVRLALANALHRARSRNSFHCDVPSEEIAGLAAIEGK